jgi:hypothetical protein
MQACLRRTVEQMGGRFGGVLFTKAWQCIVVVVTTAAAAAAATAVGTLVPSS